MRNYFIWFCISVLLIHVEVRSQGVYAPLNQEYYHLADRYEVLYGKMAPRIFTGYKGMLRKDLAAFADSVEQSVALSDVDKFNINYLKEDNWEWYEDSLQTATSKKPILKTFYEKKNALYQFRSKELEFQMNPVIHVEVNNHDNPISALQKSTTDYRYFASLNTRGVELRGLIGKKIGFYTFLTDNQAFVPDYVKAASDTARAFPGEGFTKSFKGIGYDFFSARGYFTFNIIKQVNIQFGHDKNFIGNGTRSLLLSDYAAKYLFLKLNLKVWRLNYNTMFADMTARVINGDKYNPRKYMAMHHLSLNIGKNLNIGVFEAIVFNRSDSATGNNGFELNYLNPVIFYREVESYLGSKDKTSVGADFKWNFLKRFSLYGQLLINEFKLSEVTKQNGWWANKYGWQIGLKYINVLGINNLDLQLEHNFVRPFVYTDKSALTNFSNYGQPLAHPLGANFYEYLGIVRYQPLNRLTISARIFYMIYGQDRPGTNYGGDIFKDYTTRTQEFNNLVGQGIRTQTLLVNLSISYMFFHNFYLDLRQTIRQEKNELINTNVFFTTLGLRWNIAPRLQEF